MDARRSIIAIALLVSALLAGACSALPGGRSSAAPTSTTPPPTQPAASDTATGQPTPQPSVTPGQSPSTTPAAGVTVTSEAQAAALVFASNPIFSSIRQRDAPIIGASMDYSTITLDEGYGVSITAGSGDCPSGCINQHTWNYTVSQDGRVELVSEQGDEVEVSIDPGTDEAAQIIVRLVAGPVCPVEQNPPDPSCASRPVPDAEVVLRDPTGAEVTRDTSDEAGMVTFTAPGGAYYVESAAVEGLMGQAAAEAFAVPGGRTVTITLDYDTGIR